MIAASGNATATIESNNEVMKRKKLEENGTIPPKEQENTSDKENNVNV
jgi:hypothetical protein